jgi:hypothetical protein
MRPSLALILIAQVLLVGGVTFGIRSQAIPLGVPGEWEWMRLPAWASPGWDGLIVAALLVAAYSACAAAGLRWLRTRSSPSRRAEGALVAGLLLLAIAAQALVPLGAPPGYDLSKWAAVNYLPSSSGYFKVAREQAMSDPWRFLRDYPRWIRDQDSLHIGTHPPGLITLQCLLMTTMQNHPALAQGLLDVMPGSVDAGFRAFGGNDPRPLAPEERAALFATALLTLLACAGTLVPLYLLARAMLPAPAAWTAAALWPLAPAANLFQPVADAAYPFLSTSALALAAWSAREAPPRDRRLSWRILLAAGSGSALGLGMALSLAFLPVGLIVALSLALSRAQCLRTRGALILALGSGFIAVLAGGWLATGANPLEIGTWNLHHHARFYLEYPRTYRLWLWVNLLELAIALGLPSAVWCLVGMMQPRTMPIPVFSTALVLLLVNLTGRNLGEVARLWMLFLPPLLLAAGQGCNRLGGGAVSLGISLGLLGVQTLALQAMIQVVYPV